jgi:hypothetical protein
MTATNLIARVKFGIAALQVVVELARASDNCEQTTRWPLGRHHMWDFERTYET